MEMVLQKLRIASNADVKVIERNEFEITGDITMDLCPSTEGFVTIDKLRVVYNHDGLLEHIYNGEPCVPDNDLLFTDVLTYVNMSHDGKINVDFDGGDVYDYLLTDDNSINVYADFVYYE